MSVSSNTNRDTLSPFFLQCSLALRTFVDFFPNLVVLPEGDSWELKSLTAVV